MPSSNPFTLALGDLIEDVAYHGTNLVQGAFDLMCLAALGSCFYVASLEQGQPVALQLHSAATDVIPQNATTSLCLAASAGDLQDGCISAVVLDDQIGT